MSIFDGKTILISGGTGSFGKKFTNILLSEHNPKAVRILSRGELLQMEMRSQFTDSRIRFFIGDVRDEKRVSRAMHNADIVVHAAALKQVPACEYNPFEAILTNVIGSQNIINAAIDNGVEKVMAISTDKAVNPINLYGATKLCAEKLFIQGNAYSGDSDTSFSCTRYGNVVGSRGSVIPVFLEQAKNGKITITDSRMTRFWITLDQGVRFVMKSLEEMHGGEVFIPKIPSMNIMDLAKAIAPDCAIDYIGIRPGEKIHEALISADEALQTIDVGDKYVILPAHPWWSNSNWDKGRKVSDNFSYTSDQNDHWLSLYDLKGLINEC
ncbi:MAG: UDP-N-acetylglucosamine 4,6-dehydratase (inverting) [Methanoregula sp.]|nr:UDP-N-acetylglucosamine 4,6-dehydratase (inverting) [Methanoregula sp.]